MAQLGFGPRGALAVGSSEERGVKLGICSQAPSPGWLHLLQGATAPSYFTQPPLLQVLETSLSPHPLQGPSSPEGLCYPL